MGIRAVNAGRRSLRRPYMDKAPAQLQMIAEGSDYELLSAPDASIFALRFKPETLTAHLEGEDAARFRQDYETIREQFPRWNADQTLAQLWDQGGYSWLASQEGR
jgi:hypothetical protein